MKNELIFLRHAETKKDKSIPVSQWVLTREGKEKSKNLTNDKYLLDVDIIITSTEKKAFQTAKHLADKLNKEIIQIKDLSELNRDKGEIMTKEEYDQMKVKIFEDLDFTDFGWETCNHALERFRKTVKEIDKKYENKKILIVAHGTVMTLYFSYLQNSLDNIFTRWKSLGFCDYGIVKDDRVIKDIVR
ncbi:MAG: histidine phosphatase family protein [archaeon]